MNRARIFLLSFLGPKLQVIVWKNDEPMHAYDVLEEVWDMFMDDNYLFTIRDRDLVVQRIIRTEKGNRVHVLKTIEGRSPLCRLDDKLFILSRSAFDIYVIDEKSFRKLGTIATVREEPAHDFFFFSLFP